MDKTLGESRVRVSFNPSAQDQVHAFKSRVAELIDELHALSQSTQDAEIQRLCYLAMTDLEKAAMWGVKALTA